jgi:hypothetical protein
VRNLPLADGSQPNSPELKEQLRFEVNDQSYMLSFNREDGHWYLLTTGITDGVRAIPVLSDEFGFVAHNVVPVGDGGQAGVN